MEGVELPVGNNGEETYWGSDAVASTLRAVGVEYVAMVPGSSYRGLQDSLVNFLGNRQPQMLVTLHEEHAVAIAHGYAKVMEKPMAAGLHSNVGLMHATMAIYNAYVDRMPVLLLGATGPVDSTRRRPWIDWIHTSRDQGSIIRDYVKWDEQPASPKAAVEAIARAWLLINAHPRAPAYVCLDVSDQETRIDKEAMPGDVSRFITPMGSSAVPDQVTRAADLLRAAHNPVILAGRVSRSLEAWERRIALAEALNARVITDLKTAASFPTSHPLHVGGSSQFLSEQQKQALAEADLILSLDWIDLQGTIQQAFRDDRRIPAVIQISMDSHLVNGWSYDHFGLPPVDVRLDCPADDGVALLARELAIPEFRQAHGRILPPDHVPTPQIGLKTLAGALRTAVGELDVTYIRFPLGWPADETPFEHPLSYLGGDGGAGIGSGPGLAVGAALALRGTGRLPVAVLGDGDFVMGASAIWTAAHYRLPLLVIVANNRSYFNDELHQEAVATVRGRPQANRWIGQRLEDPAIDVPGLARSLGAVAPDSITEGLSLAERIREAVTRVMERGEVVVLDVKVNPGYASAMPATVSEV
jgi:thiamine pyrophosphate-dependent acetolactate synthase large subunit-like protein